MEISRHFRGPQRSQWQIKESPSFCSIGPCCLFVWWPARGWCCIRSLRHPGRRDCQLVPWSPVEALLVDGTLRKLKKFLRPSEVEKTKKKECEEEYATLLEMCPKVEGRTQSHLSAHAADEWDYQSDVRERTWQRFLFCRSTAEPFAEMCVFSLRLIQCPFQVIIFFVSTKRF